MCFQHTNSFLKSWNIIKRSPYRSPSPYFYYNRSESILSPPPIVTTVSAHAVTSIVTVAVAFARFSIDPPKRAKSSVLQDFIRSKRQPDPIQQGPASAAFNEWCDWFDKPTEPGITDPIRYWYDRRLQYPTLSQMALDILTAQAMSAGCERLFSATGGLIDDTRSSLETTLVSMCMALRSWIRAGILAPNDIDDMVLSTAESVENSAIGQMTEDIQADLISQWLTNAINDTPDSDADINEFGEDEMSE